MQDIPFIGNFHRYVTFMNLNLVHRLSCNYRYLLLQLEEIHNKNLKTPLKYMHTTQMSNNWHVCIIYFISEPKFLLKLSKCLCTQRLNYLYLHLLNVMKSAYLTKRSALTFSHYDIALHISIGRKFGM